MNGRPAWLAVAVAATLMLVPGLAAYAQQTPASQSPDAAQPPADPAPAGGEATEDDGTTPQSMPFEGGTLTITQNQDYEKVVAYDGEELARNYVAFFDRTVEVAGINVALVSVGDGGNQCGTATLIVWKPADGGIRTDMVGEECGAPPAAVSGSDIYFVPYLAPGNSAAVQIWSPDTGIRTAGMLAFTPQPGTGWADLDPASFQNMIEAFDNEAVYADAAKWLGDDLSAVATGLMTGGGTEKLPSGIVYASGCTPHACGVADSFMAVDVAHRKLYFAHQDGDGGVQSWPDAAAWPADARSAMQAALAGQQ